MSMSIIHFQLVLVVNILVSIIKKKDALGFHRERNHLGELRG